MEFETKLYNPAAQTEEFLIEHFVVRTKVFENIFKDIRTAKMIHPEQHYLIQGQRGMGKTTLLLRLKYEIERTPELEKWLMPVFFNEDTYDLTSLSSLWEKLLKYFDAHLQDGGEYYNSTDKYINSPDYEQSCFELVLSVLRQHKKKIIILFDNFGELFLDNLSERDSHRFREILMDCADIRIIAASAVVLESNNDYSEPFFDFFKIINLKGLDKNETLDLINKLQEIGQRKIDIGANKAKIETLAILTGGVIRTIMMLYEILLNDNDGSALKNLDSILDKVTPLYKHRMEGLKPQQRRIMDVIAKNWDAIKVGDIAKNIRENGKQVSSKIVSAQLQELEKNNLVEKRKTSTKNNFYIVKERFFNIWYLMRHGDKTTQCKVKWLTRFLEMWYCSESKQIDAFIKRHIERLQSGKYISSSAILIANALMDIPTITLTSQLNIVKETEKIINDKDKKYLPKIQTQEIIDKLKSSKKAHEEGEFKKAAEILESIQTKNANLYSIISVNYYFDNQYEMAIKTSLKIYSNESPSRDSFLIGDCYYRLHNNKESLKYIRKALQEQSTLSNNQIARAKQIQLNIYEDIPEKKDECIHLANEIINMDYAMGPHEFVLIFSIEHQLYEITQKTIGKIPISDENAEFINGSLILLMSDKQYHLALNIFNGYGDLLKDRLKPTYYALMYLLKDEYPDEYLKMGEELQEPVRDILKKIKELED